MRTYELINVDMVVLGGRHCREIKYMSDIITDEIFDFRQLEDLMKQDFEVLLNPEKATNYINIFPVTAKNKEGEKVWMAIIVDEHPGYNSCIAQVPPKIVTED